MQADLKADLNLARQITSGDEKALANFYQQHADPLFGFIFHKLGGSRSDAEEIWQDTLLAALRALPTFRGESRLFTWLCAIGRRKVIDHLRRSGKHPLSLDGDNEGRVNALLDTGPMPEEIILSGTNRAEVIRILQELPGEYARALVARYGEERSVEDVAVLLGKSYKATESLIARARKAFQDSYERKGASQNER
jgi:RNA polymerase sigma-70 factor, ECF subfamily